MLWTLVLNPHAASGKGAKVGPELEGLLKEAGVAYELLVTERPGHALELVKEAVQRGARNFVAVGGDGTVNEVANGLLQQKEVPMHELLMTQVPIGTGNDWRRTLGIPTDLGKCVAMLKGWREVTQDVGTVQWEAKGEKKERYFLNIGGMGFQAYVGMVANQRKAQGKGGIMAYVGALISSLKEYKSKTVGFELDGKVLPERAVYSVAVGICKYNGGGMKQCPDAVYDDGLLDLTLINHLPKRSVIVNVPGLFSGRFVKHRAVEQHRMEALVVKGPADFLLEVDGEVIGQAPARFGIVKQGLRVATV